jgi:hypothetical protein
MNPVDPGELDSLPADPKGQKINRALLAAAAITVLVYIVQSAAAAETRVCRGLLTAN